MIDYQKLLTILIEAGALISSLAAIVAAVIMFKVRKRFGTGIIASGFKNIAFGVFFIAIGILLDAFESYVQISGFSQAQQYITIIIGAKFFFFVIGTYIIVIGSKRTGDKLESITK